MERGDRLVPVPGDVDVIMGGPPCQGVRGQQQHLQGMMVLHWSGTLLSSLWARVGLSTTVLTGPGPSLASGLMRLC